MGSKINFLQLWRLFSGPRIRLFQSYQDNKIIPMLSVHQNFLYRIDILCFVASITDFHVAINCLLNDKYKLHLHFFPIVVPKSHCLLAAPRKIRVSVFFPSVDCTSLFQVIIKSFFQVIIKQYQLKTGQTHQFALHGISYPKPDGIIYTNQKCKIWGR